jgi:hypothetical protein
MALTPRFSSPLLNSENLHVGCTNTGGVLIDRVIAGLKPLAFTDDSRPEMAREVAKRAVDAGLAVHHFCWVSPSSGLPHWFTSACVLGRIGDVFDIDALRADYRVLYANCPDYVESVESELAKIRRRDVSDYLSFSDLEVDWLGMTSGTAHPAGEYTRTGLLLGYPVASTVEVVHGAVKVWFSRNERLHNA